MLWKNCLDYAYRWPFATCLRALPWLAPGSFLPTYSHYTPAALLPSYCAGSGQQTGLLGMRCCYVYYVYAIPATTFILCYAVFLR